MSDCAEPVGYDVKLRAAEIECGLSRWIAQNTEPEDQRAAAVALLRMGVNGHIGIMGEVKAFVMLRDMFTTSLALSVGAAKDAE